MFLIRYARFCMRLFGEISWLIVDTVLLWPLRLAALKWENHLADCRPLRSNAELLAFKLRPFPWGSMVDRLDISLKSPRLLGDCYDSMDADVQQSQSTVDEETRPKMLVCHDLAGNYRGDRFLAGNLKWDDYRFYHWAGIDIFCYFSHEYVTIPTFAWIQAAHLHGVAVLGTLIFENDKGQHNLVQILKSEKYMSAIVEALVFVAKHCRFEGWLLNVECTLAPKRIPMLRRFVEVLTQRMHEEVPHGTVIWYDSIIDTGELIWQDELNDKNKQFFDACDGILLNYTWKEENLENSADAVERSDKEMAKIFVGIDVFGRGQVAGFQSNKTLAKIRQHNFSVGIFAPGWTFEEVSRLSIDIHTQRGTDICNRHFIERNNRFWALLWPSLYTRPYVKLPFYSSFCLGSGKQRYLNGVLCEPVRRWLKLNRQTLQPSVPQKHIDYNFDDSFEGGCSIKVTAGDSQGPRRLFIVDWPLEQGLVVAYAFKAVVPEEDMSLWLNVQYTDETVTSIECCSKENHSLQEVEGHRRIYPLKETDLDAVICHLENVNEIYLPKSARNDWMVRYYYVSSYSSDAARVTDIGVGTHHGQGTYLGAVRVHRGNAALNSHFNRPQSQL